MIHDGKITFPSPPPQNVPETTAAPTVADLEKTKETPNPFSLKVKETSLVTAGNSW